MTNVAALYASEHKKNVFGQARILTVCHEKRTARIYIDNLSGIQEIHAVMAMPYDIDLVRDDMVLVAGDNIDSIYIIGVLSAKSPTRIQAKDGSYALLTDTDNKSSLQIFSKNDELIIEYDPEKEKTTVSSATGDLDFIAPAGNIKFQSSESIVFKSETICLESRKKFKAMVQDHPGSSASTLSLGKHQMKLSCPDLRITAKKSSFFLDELKITGKRFLANLLQATIKADKLETRAQSIINKAKNMYQSVENLSQLKTGRLKTIIKTTYHLKSKNTVLKSEDDFKIKADKINLG